MPVAACRHQSLSPPPLLRCCVWCFAGRSGCGRLPRRRRVPRGWRPRHRWGWAVCCRGCCGGVVLGKAEGCFGLQLARARLWWLCPPAPESLMRCRCTAHVLPLHCPCTAPVLPCSWWRARWSAAWLRLRPRQRQPQCWRHGCGSGAAVSSSPSALLLPHPRRFLCLTLRHAVVLQPQPHSRGDSQRRALCSPPLPSTHQPPQCCACRAIAAPHPSTPAG
jgi:hypothetical protein